MMGGELFHDATSLVDFERPLLLIRANGGGTGLMVTSRSSENRCRAVEGTVEWLCRLKLLLKDETTERQFLQSPRCSHDMVGYQTD
jgi:hypothetical protein